MINISTPYQDALYIYKYFYFAAILIGVAGAVIVARRQNISYNQIAFTVACGIFSLIVGSKLIMFSGENWQSLLFEHSLPVQTGKSILGALLGGVIGVFIAGKLALVKKSPLDWFAVSLPVAMAVQRIGCLFAGCCHGIATQMPWGITYGQATMPFKTQQALHLIGPGATQSLMVHPDQVYHIIACLFIALLVWKTKEKWKAPSSLLIFSVLLYLTFRFAEEFSRFHFNTTIVWGLNTIQWKILLTVTILLLTLLFKEKNYKEAIAFKNDNAGGKSYGPLNQFFFSLLVVFIAYRYAHWFTADERMIILFTVFPACAFSLMSYAASILFSLRTIKSISLACLALLLMAQKADSPADTPASYTAFSASVVNGRFDLKHQYNWHEVTRTYSGTDCTGMPYNQTVIVPVADTVKYKHTYWVGSIGISRKKYYNKWQSTTASLNLCAGRETQKATSGYPLEKPKVYHNTLYGINPSFVYDGRGIGLGIGGTLGIMGYDNEENADDNSDYNPNEIKRKSAIHGRLRFFSERYLFLETMGGFDNAGSLGDYHFVKIMAGTRFNSNKYMLKLGYAASDVMSSGYIAEGEFYIKPNLYVAPQLIIHQSFYDGKPQYRTGLTLQYRYYGKKK